MRRACVLTVFVDDGAPASCQIVNNIVVVLEETNVLQDLPHYPTAFAYLVDLLYALNIEFLKHIRYTVRLKPCSTSSWNVPPLSHSVCHDPL